MPNPALSATPHGLLSELPVLDGFETRAAWLAHRQRFWDDLHPRGAVEEALVERLALTFWRMARLARAEVAAAQRHRDQQIEQAGRVWSAELQSFLTLEEAREELLQRDRVCDWLAAFADPAGSDPLSPPLVKALRRYLEQVVDEYIADLEDGPPPTGDACVSAPVEPRPASTAGDLRALFQQVAFVTHQPLAAVLSQVTTLAREAAYTFSRAVRDAERQVAQVRATVQLPPEPELQLFTRCDAHLGRELARLFRTLRDLQAQHPEAGGTRDDGTTFPAPPPPVPAAGASSPIPASNLPHSGKRAVPGPPCGNTRTPPPRVRGS